MKEKIIYKQRLKEVDGWYDINDNSRKKLVSLTKPFSSMIRRDEKLGKVILASIIQSVNKHYAQKLTYQEVFSLVKKIVKDTSIDDFNWDDEDLKEAIEQNFKI